MSFLQYKIPNEFKAKRSEAKKKKTTTEQNVCTQIEASMISWVQNTISSKLKRHKNHPKAQDLTMSPSFHNHSL